MTTRKEFSKKVGLPLFQVFIGVCLAIVALAFLFMSIRIIDRHTKGLSAVLSPKSQAVQYEEDLVRDRILIPALPSAEKFAEARQKLGDDPKLAVDTFRSAGLEYVEYAVKISSKHTDYDLYLKKSAWYFYLAAEILGDKQTAIYNKVNSCLLLANATAFDEENLLYQNEDNRHCKE